MGNSFEEGVENLLENRKCIEMVERIFEMVVIMLRILEKRERVLEKIGEVEVDVENLIPFRLRQLKMVECIEDKSKIGGESSNSIILNAVTVNLLEFLEWIRLWRNFYSIRRISVVLLLIQFIISILGVKN